MSPVTKPGRPPQRDRWPADRELLARARARAEAAEGPLSDRRLAELVGLDPTQGSHLRACAKGQRGLTAAARAALEGYETGAPVNPVRALCAAKGWTRQDLARHAGCSERTARYWIEGRTPSPVWRARLAELGADIDAGLIGRILEQLYLSSRSPVELAELLGVERVEVYHALEVLRTHDLVEPPDGTGEARLVVLPNRRLFRRSE